MQTITGRLFLGILLVAILSASAFAQSTKHVLVLNSYHPGFKWTDEETQGVTEGLLATGKNIKFYIEYMGTKWAFGNAYFSNLHTVYAQKFKGIRFDLIVATDDDALTFLLNHRDQLFGTIPVVFCGVNWFNQDRIRGHRNYTGVNEDADLESNLELMLRLHPEVKEIYLVVDRTTTGLIVQHKIRELSPKYLKRVTMHILDDVELSELSYRVSKLPANSLLFLTIFQQDRHGAFVEYSDIAQTLSLHSQVPLYGLWDFYLGFGIVGGMLTSGYAQGQSAGAMAARILMGENPEAIPVVMDSPNRYRFDHRELQRFGIPTKMLPRGSIVIHRPASVYAITKEYVWAVILGGILGILIIITLSITIHRRIQAEKALRVSEEKYHSLVDHLNVGVFRNTGGPHGRFLQINPAMITIYGYPSVAELMEVQVSDLYQNPSERVRFIEDLSKNGFIKNLELPMKKMDGTPIWVLCSASAMFDEKHEIRWIEGVHEDITERKQLEAQLLQAQKMEAIGTLAGGVAHDFNNILTAIIGYANLLKMKHEGNQEISYYLDPILSAAEKAAQLTRSLLAFSRKQIISLKPVNLNEIVEGMGKILERVIGEDIELQILPNRERLNIMADQGQIEQVILNLVTNARDAITEGGTIHIETDCMALNQAMLIKHEFLNPGNYAVVSVSDTGVGMDEETQKRIFEPFFCTKTMGKGTGLGLSIVYGIVKQHNGDISVYSEVGKGTNFKIYLPLVMEATHEKPKSIPDAPIEGGDETILIGEDNDAVRNLARDALSHGGYTVLLGKDGEEAIELFRAHSDRIDLLLLDVVLPKKNGKEVYQEIKRLNPNVKVLFMSGYTANIIHKKGVLDEGLNFLPKPLTPEGLLRKVREVLSNSEKETPSG